MKKNGGAPDHEANNLKKRLEEGLDSLAEGLKQPSGNFAQPPKTVKPGDLVEITHLNTRGTVLSLPDSRGEVQLQAGIMKLKANLSQLRLVEEPKKKKQVSSVQVNTGAMERTVRMSCDVRGLALDEALEEVDQYLDEAVLAGLNEVTIVHGKGTGILREGIQRALKTNGHVKSFRRGQYGEGEEGVTVVQLK